MPARIRAAIPEDVPAIAAIYNHAVAQSTATFDTQEKSAPEMQQWFESHGKRHPVLVAETEGSVRGWAALSPWSDRAAYADTAENSVYVHESARGRGIGKALLAALIEAARKQVLHSIIARVAEGNPASDSLHLAAGFTPVGTMREVGRKFGKWIDVRIYQLML